jgi:hypothetical protein
LFNKTIGEYANGVEGFKGGQAIVDDARSGQPLAHVDPKVKINQCIRDN